MSQQTQLWGALPDHIKRQAAPAMLSGQRWIYFGREVVNPGTRELRRWLPLPEPIAARSNAAKRQAVLELLLLMPRRTSAREIARRAGTSHPFVSKVRAEVMRD